MKRGKSVHGAEQIPEEKGIGIAGGHRGKCGECAVTSKFVGALCLSGNKALQELSRSGLLKMKNKSGSQVTLGKITCPSIF